MKKITDYVGKPFLFISRMWNKSSPMEPSLNRRRNQVFLRKSEKFLRAAEAFDLSGHSASHPEETLQIDASCCD
jgi:hypothetical protein